jgi:hypothetical protein
MFIIQEDSCTNPIWHNFCFKLSSVVVQKSSRVILGHRDYNETNVSNFADGSVDYA